MMLHEVLSFSIFFFRKISFSVLSELAYQTASISNKAAAELGRWSIWAGPEVKWKSAKEMGRVRGYHAFGPFLYIPPVALSSSVESNEDE